MAQNSTQQLSDTLRRKQQEDAERIEAQTRQRLAEHDEHLRQLASDSLRAAGDATRSETTYLYQSLERHRRKVESLTKDLQAIHKREARRLRWIMRFPLLIVLIASLLLSGGIWGWWQMNQPWEVITAESGEDFQVIDGDWMMCAMTSGEELPCRPVPDGLIDSIRR